MWDASSTRLVVHLPFGEADRFRASCLMAGVRSPACWIRHAVFGDAPRRRLLPVDAAIADGLHRLSDRATMLRAIVVRGRTPAATQEQAMIGVAALVEQILAAAKRLDAPYAAGVVPWIPSVDENGTRCLACVASEREQAAVDQAAKRLGLSRSAWIRSALVEAGLPAPATSIFAEQAVQAMRAMQVVVQGLVDAEDPVATTKEIGRMLAFHAKTFGGGMARLSEPAKAGAA